MLNRRFGGKERSFGFEKLAKIKQNGRIDEYIQDFELLVSQEPQTGEEQLLGYSPRSVTKSDLMIPKRNLLMKRRRPKMWQKVQQ